MLAGESGPTGVPVALVAAKVPQAHRDLVFPAVSEIMAVPDLRSELKDVIKDLVSVNGLIGQSAVDSAEWVNNIDTALAWDDQEMTVGLFSQTLKLATPADSVLTGLNGPTGLAAHHVTIKFKPSSAGRATPQFPTVTELAMDMVIVTALHPKLKTATSVHAHTGMNGLTGPHAPLAGMDSVPLCLTVIELATDASAKAWLPKAKNVE